MKPVLRRLRFASLLHSATSDCSRVALLLFPICRRGQRWRCYRIDFVFLGACSPPSLPLQRAKAFCHRARACHSRRSPAGGSIISGRTWFHLPSFSSQDSSLLLSWWRICSASFCARPSVNTEVLCASISAYLMLGLMWTVAYWLVARLTPGVPSRSTRTQVRDPSRGSVAFTLASSH